VRFEQFRFGLIGICVLVGAAVGAALVGMEGIANGMLAGAVLGVIVAVSLLRTDAE
jgi:hypothetical protein